jgi:hypothetical protein
LRKEVKRNFGIRTRPPVSRRLSLAEPLRNGDPEALPAIVLTSFARSKNRLLFPVFVAAPRMCRPGCLDNVNKRKTRAKYFAFFHSLRRLRRRTGKGFCKNRMNRRFLVGLFRGFFMGCLKYFLNF